MRFNDYQNIAHSYGIYPVGMGPSYLCLGLAGETGEVCDKIKKVYRDKEGEFSEEDIKQIEKELGDVLWYLSELSHSLGIDLGNVASENISKLENRRKRNTIHGSGDDR